MSATSRRDEGGGGRFRALAARSLWVVCLAYVFFLLTAVAVLWWGGDHWWPGTVLLFGPRWVLGLPLPLLVPLALWLAPRGTVLLGVAILLYLFPLMGLRVAFPSRGGEEDLTLLTLNAYGGRRLIVPLDELVEASDADLVAIQECPHDVRTAARLLEVEGYGFHSHRGLCFLSRFPFRVGETSWRPQEWSDTATGTAARYEIEVEPGDTVSFTNLHLPTPRSGLEAIRLGRFQEGIDELNRSRGVRAAAAEMARGLADRGFDSRLVAGDFNAPPESRIQRRVWGGFRDAFSVRGTGFGHTRYNGWIRARIDHVLTDESWRVLEAVVGEDVGSDHRPLRVRLTRRR